MTKKYTERVFDDILENKDVVDYSRLQGRPGRRDRKIMEALYDYGIVGKRCLDVGPGTGRWLTFLKDKEAKELHAIDISRVSLDKCKHICNSTHKIDVESETFPYESDYFDIVISFMVMEHLRDPGNYLSEIVRVAKPNGIVLISIPNILSFLSRIRIVLGFMPSAISSDRTHVKFYNKKSLKELLAGFNQSPHIIPTSFSIHPFNSRSLRIPTNRVLSSFDDHTLFSFIVNKK